MACDEVARSKVEDEPAVDLLVKEVEIEVVEGALGIFALSQRARSLVHDSGRYSCMSTGTCSVGVHSVRLTPIWQLAILPTDPVYCRCTPGDSRPCFMNLCRRSPTR